MTFLWLFIRICIVVCLNLWITAPGNKCFNYAFTMKLWLTDSPVGTHLYKDKDVGCSVLYLILAATGIHQKHRWESGLQIFFLIIFICLWLLSLNTLTWERHVLVQSQRRWLSYCEAMRHHFVSTQSATASVSSVRTWMPTQWSLLDFPPLSHFQMTNGIKCEQVLGWRDPQ